MLDIGWSELLFLAIIVLLVLGPREIPSLLRQVGRFSAYSKQMASRFRQGLNVLDDEMAALKKLDDSSDLFDDTESVTPPTSVKDKKT